MGKTDISNENTQLELQMRTLHCELNALTRADGSVLLTQGETAVISSVNGPVDVKLQNLQIEKSHVEVYYRAKVGQPSITDRLYEQIIKNTCETALLTVLYPRTAITIQLQEMENRGGLIACSINASCLALLNSGISMKFLIAAVNCVVLSSGEIIVDPDKRQTVDSIAEITFVFDNTEKNLVAVHSSGRYTIAQYNDANLACQQASEIIFKFYRQAVEKYANVV